MPNSDVQKFLEEEKKRSERKQELIQQILAERDAKIAEYDEHLALLGYNLDPVSSLSGGSSRPGRPKGRQMSEETKAKMKASQQARWAAKKSGSAT